MGALLFESSSDHREELQVFAVCAILLPEDSVPKGHVRHQI